MKNILLLIILPFTTFSQDDCIDDDIAAAALANMWNPDITSCEDAIPYLSTAGYPCETDLSVLGMSGTIADICECTCLESSLGIIEGIKSEEIIRSIDLLGRASKNNNTNITIVITNQGAKKIICIDCF